MIQLNSSENKRHLVAAQEIADNHNITLKLHHKYGSCDCEQITNDDKQPLPCKCTDIDVFVSATHKRNTIEWHRTATNIVINHPTDEESTSLPDYVNDIRNVLDSTLFTALIP